MRKQQPVNRVIAVVPTFQPGEDVLDRLAALASQVEAVIVADDGSTASAAGVLGRIEEEAHHAVLRSAANRGIAAALNSGTRLALELGADYVLTIDQDSTLPEGYVDACLGVFNAAASATRIGVVCVDRINDVPSIPPGFSPEGFGLVHEAIQSGLMISRECLTECGLFDESLFIDGVDTEFCLRAADHGFRIAIAAGTNLQHELGRQVPLKPFGVQTYRDGQAITYEYHGPVRRYFIVRNNIDLWLRYRASRPRWVVSSVRREVEPGVRHLIAGPYRFRQLLAAAIGTVDGLRRSRGPMRRRVRALLTPRDRYGAQRRS